jgi:hypothetical protein
MYGISIATDHAHFDASGDPVVLYSLRSPSPGDPEGGNTRVSAVQS